MEEIVRSVSRTCSYDWELPATWLMHANNSDIASSKLASLNCFYALTLSMKRHNFHDPKITASYWKKPKKAKGEGEFHEHIKVGSLKLQWQVVIIDFYSASTSRFHLFNSDARTHQLLKWLEAFFFSLKPFIQLWECPC